MLKILKSEAGFTLIEVVFVVIILAILAGVALMSFGGLDTQAKDAVVQADFRTIATALKVYKAQTGAFPATILALTADAGSYTAVMDAPEPTDPYSGAAYGYDVTGLPDSVDVTSGSTAHPSITVK